MKWIKISKEIPATNTVILLKVNEQIYAGFIEVLDEHIVTKSGNYIKKYYSFNNYTTYWTRFPPFRIVLDGKMEWALPAHINDQKEETSNILLLTEEKD